MDNFEDFIAMNPEASYEDFARMQDIMHQDIMASTLPQVDMESLSPITTTIPSDGVMSIQPMGSYAPVVDMFGNPHFVDPMNVDIMSGLPSSCFHVSQPTFTGSESVESFDQWKLDKGNEIESMRDTAVEHYKDAKARGDLDEMLKWETEANKQQGRLYDHWGTPTYGLPPKAPGIS
jgi:hypothetical protein